MKFINGTLLLGCLLCASCAGTPVMQNINNEATATVPDQVVVVQVPARDDQKRYCTQRPPVGSRIAKRVCLTEAQRRRNNEEGKKLLEQADRF